MPRPISATIHLASIADNLALARAAAPSSKVWAVVKANAYGHGIARIYPALERADGIALLDLDEANLVRELGWKKPLLLLEGFFEPVDLVTLDSLKLATTVHCEEQLRMLELNDPHLVPRSVDVYLKMNSGMNRLGFCPSQYRKAWERLNAIECVRNITHMTHFSDADTFDGITGQMAVFRATVDGLPGAHCVANSAGTLWHLDARTDWVRAGIMLYGASPSGCWSDVAVLGLKAAMTLKSRILAVQDVKAGQCVGYGPQYVAPHAQRIGIVACGYADGYPRTSSSHAGHSAPIRVGTYSTTTVGRVSMDMLAVNLTECPDVSVGTPVELWGKHVAIDSVAAAAGTIGYELMCSLASRVPVFTETQAPYG